MTRGGVTRGGRGGGGDNIPSVEPCPEDSARGTDTVRQPDQKEHSTYIDKKGFMYVFVCQIYVKRFIG